MDNLGSRLVYLIIGCVIGFVLGYLVRSLREVREKVEEIDHTLHPHDETDDGRVSGQFIQNCALFIVVAMTIWSFISSQAASNDSSSAKSGETQNSHRLDQVVACDEAFLTSTIVALNSRTQYSGKYNHLNTQLAKAQAQFLGIYLVVPPPSPAQSRAAFKMYFNKLTKFVQVSGQNSTAIHNNPYPKVKDFERCISTKHK